MIFLLGVGFLIGLVLGLLGGGGSILTVPALVYLAGQAPQVAVTASLLIVGANSAAGVLMHHHALSWRVALLFGGVGMAMSYLFAGLSKAIDPTLLLIMFASLMLLVGLLMIYKPMSEGAREPRHWSVVVLAGAGVGALTGLLGVGGGFLIVPSLVMLVGLSMSQAVGTSLIIITMNSLAGLLGHWGVAIDWALVSAFIVMGLLGTFVGTKLGQRLQGQQLQKLFALFVIGLACLLLLDNVGKLT
jgi:uncharacterized membrane protein YfcA